MVCRVLFVYSHTKLSAFLLSSSASSLLAMAKEGALAKLLQRLQPWKVCVCVRRRARKRSRESVARAGLESARLSLSLSPCRMPHGTSSGESRAGVRP